MAPHAWPDPAILTLSHHGRELQANYAVDPHPGYVSVTTPDEVKRSYRELVKVWHPDRFSHDPKLQSRAQEKLKVINAAYERLCESFERSGNSHDTQPRHPRPNPSKSAANKSSSENEHQPKRPPPPAPPAPQPRTSGSQADWAWRIRALAAIIVVVIVGRALLTRNAPPLNQAPSAARQSTGIVPTASPQPKPQDRKKLGIDQILSLYESASKSLPEPKMSVQEFSRYAQTKAPAYDFSAGFEYVPPLPATKVPQESVEAAPAPGPVTSSTARQPEASVASTESVPEKKEETNTPIATTTAPASLAPRQSPSASMQEHGITWFTQGSPKDDVIRLQGTPDGIDRYDALDYEVWHYGSASVDISIRGGRVIKWSNARGRLKVAMVPGVHATSATSFTQGSPKDDVIRLQGTPDDIDHYEALDYEVWHYGSASVDISIRGGRVIKWTNAGGRLKVTMISGAGATTATSFTQGSSKDDVIRLQGTPDDIDHYEALGYEVWHYGSASVDISIPGGRVTKWSNAGSRLKVTMAPGARATTASSFTQGSSKDDVVRLQGTPDGIDRYEALGYEVWHYGSASVDISTRDGRVLKWSNTSGRLKVGQPPSRSDPL